MFLALTRVFLALTRVFLALTRVFPRVERTIWYVGACTWGSTPVLTLFPSAAM